jgi:ABC-2 type transport system permease protein
MSTAADRPPVPSSATAGPSGADPSAGLSIARWRRTSAGELLINLTMRDIRSQYKRTVLGRLWSFVNPLATIAIFWFVFGVVFEMQPPAGNTSGLHSYPLYLTAGLIPWTFISSSITSGMTALTTNAGLLTKVYFPRHVLVVSTVLSLGATFLIELSVVTAIMWAFGGPRVLIFIPGVLIMTVITGVFCTGIALMLSVALVYFRDTQHFVGIFMQIWFYGSAIIYSFEILLPKLEAAANHVIIFGHPFPFTFLFRLNPAVRITNCYRSMLYDFELPSWSDLVGSIAWAAVAIAVGAWIFRRFAPRLVEEL